MTRSMWLVALAVFLVSAVSLRYVLEPAGESDRQVGAPSPEQAAIERMLERTLRESRTGDEAPSAIPAPSGDSLPPAASPPQARPSQIEVSMDPLPEGYSLGTYRGAMQRAPRSGTYVSEPEPNPDWLGTSSAYDAILDQAARSGRAYTFVVLRVTAGTDLQALSRSLVALDSRMEGSTGEYVRVRVPSERGRLEAIGGLDGVLGLGAVPPEIKAVEAFVQEVRSRPAGEQVPVYITLMTPDPSGEWRRALTGLGVVVGAYDSDLRSYTANMPAAALAPVLASDFVLSVEPVPIVTANHASAVPVMGVDSFRRYDPATARFSGFTGSGVSVGVLDTGLNTSHMDIAFGRESICGVNFVAGEDWNLWLDLNGHGTHVVGTIAGAGRSNPVLAGMAPAVSHLRFAKVLPHNAPGVEEDIRRAMDYLSRPTSCLWQGRSAVAVRPLIVNMSLAAVSLAFSGRGVGERKLDSVVYGDSQLYVVAQANAANQGFSNYGTAKNSLAVGAVYDSGIIAEFSSHGPTADGRLSPNVVGTGVDLTSVRGSAAQSGHKTLSGTSMAAPSVAGVAALLMEARPDFRNRSALTRARLMASAIRPHAYFESRKQLPADNTDGPGAFNNQYGLGLVSARTSLLSRDGSEGWLIGSATSRPENDSYEYIDIEVPDGASRLDVVLTWDEQPADTLTRSVLNNLDLWADQGADCDEDACGESASRSKVDNIEWLSIKEPVPGTYRIKVVPVEVYGEPSTAAVAWKILRGEPVPQLEVVVEDTSAGTDNEYITLDVTVNTSHYLASGTTVQLGCRNGSNCAQLHWGYLPERTRVYRQDGLSGSETDVVEHELYPRSGGPFPPISVGEVAAGDSVRAQLWFRSELFRDGVQPIASVTASSWNAKAAGQCLVFGMGALENDSLCNAPANDNFAASERIEGVTGDTPADLLLASREPGEPLAFANSKTLWYTWQAPADGLFRFRLRETDTGSLPKVDFALFTGQSLADLDLMIDKKDGSEIAFAAQADTVYRLRIAHDSWIAPPPLTLTWESADTRPANDDFAYAQSIDGEEGQIESTNQGATLENGEFLGGTAATVWYEWTAPEDGLWQFEVTSLLVVKVFEGVRVDALRLLSGSGNTSVAYVVARRGETYRIAVGARSADASALDFRVTWRRTTKDALPGTNSLFEDAIEIEGREGRASLAGHGSVAEPGEPVTTGTATRWWHWTAPANGRYTWRMDQSYSDAHGVRRTSTAYLLTIFTGNALEDLVFVGSLRSGGAGFVLDATVGTRYWIAVGRTPDLLGALQGPFVLLPTEFTWGQTPVNDDRTKASPLAGVIGSDEAMLDYATKAPDEPSDSVGANSVWWRWSAPESGWQRFWVEGHPIFAMLSVYPDAVSTRAIADSERTFLANGYVEVYLLASAGQKYDIRLSTRSALHTLLTGTREELSATLRWEAADAPAFLAYKGAVTLDSLPADIVSQGYRSPRSLAASDDGHYIFSSSESGIFAFVRDPDSGDLALVYRTPTTMETSGTDETLWWSARDDRLLVVDTQGAYSVALPENGTSLSPSKITLHGGDETLFRPSGLSPDGRHFYGQDGRPHFSLQAYSVDSPTQWTRVQTVASQSVPDDDALIVAGVGAAVDMTFSSDGLWLYVATANTLLVFSRDTSSGRLRSTRQIQRNNSPDNPFSIFGDIRHVSLSGDHAMLFVSGENFSTTGFVRNTRERAIAAFEISTDPSDPAHLDTLSRLAWQNDRDIYFGTKTHILDLGPFMGCGRPLPHAGRAAVDVICGNGFFVVEWNQATGALEVTDAARTGAEDRFGSFLPYERSDSFLEQRQIAQSRDGAHIYVATDVASRAWGYTDAIHIFERASAMTPGEGGGDTGGLITEPPDEVDDAPETGMKRDCYPGLLVGIGESCTYPGTTDEFSVNARGRGSFLGRLAGIRIRIDNETINGRVYDFLATHQGEGVWRIDRVAGMT